METAVYFLHRPLSASLPGLGYSYPGYFPIRESEGLGEVFAANIDLILVCAEENSEQYPLFTK